ncbi:hypothetical protein [Nakamurella endophytica]|nr:hypothetical protein [Nakamurella endophytica]
MTATARDAEEADWDAEDVARGVPSAPVVGPAVVPSGVEVLGADCDAAS